MEFNYYAFKENVLKNLIDYKLNVLKIKENGIFSRNKKEYSHILPKNKEIYNLIVSKYRMELWDLIKRSKIKLHKDFHHLNSSQALCFNLFYPIIKEDKLNIINNINKNIIGWEFEYIPDQKEKTNFDLFIQTEEENYFFEIKYTEPEFGSKILDETINKKYNEIYKDKLIKFQNITKEIFYENYQIFRNLCYIDYGIINFIFPKSRIDLENKINIIINNHCDIKLKKRIKIIYIEDIVNNSILDKNLIEYYEEFSRKYNV